MPLPISGTAFLPPSFSICCAWNRAAGVRVGRGGHAREDGACKTPLPSLPNSCRRLLHLPLRAYTPRPTPGEVPVLSKHVACLHAAAACLIPRRERRCAACVCLAGPISCLLTIYAGRAAAELMRAGHALSLAGRNCVTTLSCLCCCFGGSLRTLLAYYLRNGRSAAFGWTVQVAAYSLRGIRKGAVISSAMRTYGAISAPVTLLRAACGSLYLRLASFSV